MSPPKGFNVPCRSIPRAMCHRYEIVDLAELRESEAAEEPDEEAEPVTAVADD